MISWRRYTKEQLSVIMKVLPPLVGERAESQICPSCGEAMMRWYGYQNPYRSSSTITYVWCSSCRHYFGETTAGDLDLADPFEGSIGEKRKALESDLGQFFTMLDGLWQSGELPQVRLRGARL